MALEEQGKINRHTLKAKLFPNYLAPAGGKYLARTVNEKVLTIQDIAAEMVKLDGYAGSEADAIAAISSFIRTRNHKLKDGYAFHDGFTTYYLHVGGTFDSPKDPIDPAKITMKYVSRRALKEMIATEVKGTIVEVAHHTGEIFVLKDDEGEGLPENIYEPGNFVSIRGDKIKLKGPKAAVGVFFVPEDSPADRVKMARVSQNSANYIQGIAPNTMHVRNRIEIVTFYSGGGVALTKPRVITGDFIIEAM